MSSSDLYQSLETSIQESYESSLSIPEAEKLAGKCLHAMLKLTEEIKDSDLNSRMRKNGLKAIRAAVYMEAATKDPKKPSDTLLEHLVNLNELVQSEQSSFDSAEIHRDHLQNRYNVFKEAHLFFRGIAKGAFNG